MSDSRGLTGRQRRYLRAHGHGLRPAVAVGRQGITGPVLASVREAWNTAELVKVRLERACDLDRRQAAQQLATATGSHLVQILGRTILLYRPDPEQPVIQLP